MWDEGEVTEHAHTHATLMNECIVETEIAKFASG